MVSPLRRLTRTGLLEPQRTKPPATDALEPSTITESPRNKYNKRSTQYTSGMELKERYNPFNLTASRKKFSSVEPDHSSRPSPPVGTVIISPISSEKSDLPPRSPAREFGKSSPSRRRLFERRTPPPYPKELRVETKEQQFPESRDQVELELLREKNTKTESHLQVLHERFHHIQQGLGTIDQERATLVGKAEKLEQEKRAIQRQLDLRDKEILTLVKRCASQEERMREASQIRATNKELSNRLESAKKKTRKLHEEEDSITTLRKQLQESELAREELQDRLAKVQRERDTIADTLQECLANISRLTEEKREVEEERRRERKMSQIELEKQRLEHIQVANCLKDDIEDKRMKIQQMEHILKGNIISNTSLRREKAILSDGQAQEVQKVADQYEREIAELKQHIKDTEKEKDRECEAKLETLRLEIQDMEAMMRNLESEFSRQMQDLMVKQRSLDESEEERKTLEDKVETMERVSHEHSALLDIVGIMDSNLADLTNENAQLSLDKETLLVEVEEMKQKTQEVQSQIKRMKDHRKAREDDFRDLLQAEKEEYAEEIKSALDDAKAEVERLKNELASRNRWISKLEEEISEARKSVIAKEEKIREICNEHEVSKSSLKLSLSEAQAETSQLEHELLEKERSLASTEGKLDVVRNLQAEDRKRMSCFEEARLNLSRHRKYLISDTREDVSPDLTSSGTREMRDPAEKYTTAGLRQKLETKILASKETEKALREEIASLRNSRESLQQQIVSKNMVISKRDGAINSLQEAQAKNDARCYEVEEKLRNVTSELVQYQNEIQLLHKTNSALEIEAEYSNMSKDVEDKAAESFCNDVVRLDTEMEDLNSRYHKLEKDVKAGNDMVSKREKRIQELERDYEVLLESKVSVEAALAGANEKIQDLQRNLEKKNVLFLEKSLKEAQKELSKQEMKALSVEKQYSETMQLKRENYNREACTRIAALEDQLSEYKSKIEELINSLESSNKSLSERNQKIEELEEQVKAGDEKVSVLEKKIEKKEENLDSLDSLLEERKKKCSDQKEVIEADKRIIKDLQDRMKSLQSERDEQEIQRRQVEEQISQHDAEVSKLKAAKESVVSKLQTEKDSADERAECLNSQLKDAHKELDSINMRLQEADSKIAEKSLLHSHLESQNKKTESEILRLRTELEQKNDTVSSLNEKISSIEENSISLATKLSCVSSNLEETIENGAKKEKEWEDEKLELIQKLEVRDEELKGLQDDLAIRTEKVDTLQKSTEDLSQLKESLEGREHELLSKCKILEEEAIEKNREMETQNKSWQELLDQAQSSCDRAESEVSKLHKDKEVLKARIDDATEEISLLDEELSKRNQKVDSLEHDIEKLKKSEIEEAFVESEKKRILTEDMLRDSREEIKTLKAKLEQTESRLMNVDLELETTKSSVEEKDNLLTEAQLKCTDLEAKASELDGLVESREQRLLSVDEELHIAKRQLEQKDDEIRSLESLKAVLQSSLDKAHGELSSLTELSESRRQKISSADEEISIMRQSLEEKNTGIACMENSLEVERETTKKLAEENSSLQLEISDKKSVIEANVKDIVSLEEALGYEREAKNKTREENKKLQSEISDKLFEIDTHMEEIAQQKNQILLVQNDLQNKSKALEEEQERRQKEQKDFEGEQERWRTHVRAFEADIKKMKTTISLMDDEIRELKLVELKDAEQTIESLTSENNSIKNQLKDFESKTKKMETELVLKDDEIRDLRLVELKDAEQMIESLTSDIDTLKEELDDQKALADELETDKNKWKQRADEASEMADLTTEEYERTIELYKSQTQQLKESNQQFKTEVSKQDEKLKERHATIMSLTQTQASLQEEQNRWQRNCEKLQKSESKMREEVEKTKMALDVGIRREREDADIKMQGAAAAYLKELASLQGNLSETSEKLAETQKALEERGVLLRDMVDHNKDIESKFELNQNELEAVKIEAERHRKAFDSNKKELLGLRTKFRETERSLKSKYNEELERRESAEKALAKMKVQLNVATKSKRMVSTLEKENEQLKDKISRQEAFLQRKLQKEKQSRLAPMPPSPNRLLAGSPPPIPTRPSEPPSPNRPPLPPSPPKKTTQSQLKTPPRRTSGSTSGMKDLALEVE